jgi:hypothetical protein
MGAAARAGEDGTLHPEWLEAISLSLSFPFLIDERSELSPGAGEQLGQVALFRGEFDA